jgi:hypothetical protein
MISFVEAKSPCINHRVIRGLNVHYSLQIKGKYIKQILYLCRIAKYTKYKF